MAKNTCKLCARRFASPRALSGHMRSHSLATAAARSQQISSASSSVAAGDDDNDAKMAVQAYVLREKPKRRVRLGESDGFSDRESDAEYPPPQSPGAKKRRAHAGSGDAAEPVSSLSDAATPEEDVARSLMMLSRDTWPAAPAAPAAWPYYYYSDDDGSDGGGGDARAVARATAAPPRRTEFQCPACKKVFRSYQALGGHRASHVRGGRGGCCAPPLNPPPRAVPTHLQPLPECDGGGGGEEGSRAPHVCPYCSRAFPSGKALGGHKRSQLCSAAAVAAASGADPAAAIDLIDLNLPVRWDDVVELSAVSDPFLSSKSPGS